MALDIAPVGTKLGVYQHRKKHGALTEVRYAHPEGDNANDGLTWGSSKQTIQAALDSLAQVGGEGRGIVKIGGAHTVTSTINLTGRSNITFSGEADVAGIVPFMPSPAATINAQSITAGAVFYCDNTTDRTSGNFLFENLSIAAGRTGMRFIEMANIRFRDVGINCLNDGHADNCSVLMENSFWGWYRDCAFHAPVGSTEKPAVILRGLTTNVDAQQSGLQRFQNVTFGGGCVEVQQLNEPTAGGNWYFENCISENATTPMLKLTEGAGLTTNWHDHAVVFINCAHADQTPGYDMPILYVDSPHAIVNSPVFIGCMDAVNDTATIATAYILKNGFVNSARMMGSNRTARFGVDENDLIAGSWLSDKEWGFDLIAPDNTSYDILNNSGGPAIRLSPGGQAYSQVGISSRSNTGITFGDGTTNTNDTNLYRSNPNQLKTDDQFWSASSLVADAGLILNGGDILQEGAGTFHQFNENGTADPTAPAANKAKLYIKDNGAGKTQLCVRFNTGAVQVIATEP